MKINNDEMLTLAIITSIFGIPIFLGSAPSESALVGNAYVFYPISLLSFISYVVYRNHKESKRCQDQDH